MLLLDTHVLLWILGDSEKLSGRARKVLLMNDCSISIASLWELAIKASLVKAEKRLDLPKPIEQIVDTCNEQGIEILPITPEDCARVMTLPHIHEDPFDRIIVAQAMERGLPLVSKDENIAQYDGVEVVW